MTRNELLEALQALRACDPSLEYVRTLDPYAPAEAWDGGRILPGWYAWLICRVLPGVTVQALAKALVADCEARHAAGWHDRLGLLRAQYALERIQQLGEDLPFPWPVLEGIFLGALPITGPLVARPDLCGGQIAALRAHAPWAEIERAIPVAVAKRNAERAHEPA